MPKSSTRRGLGRRAALAAGGSLLAFPAIHARAAGNGVALVIGNSKYQWEAQLPNVRRDAPDVAKRFQAYGLQTDLQMDLTRDAMRAAFDKFAKAAAGANFSAIYFAGHGASYNRDSYIVPIDADLTDPSAVDNLVALSAIRRGRAQHRLVVLDACRNNPADGWRQQAAMQMARGRPPAAGTNADAAPEAPVNGLILFSTAPGRVAVDGPSGQNSPFCSAFMRQFDSGSVEIQSMPGRLRRDLLIATQGRQVVWDQNSYREPFTITGAAGGSGASRGGWAGDPSKIVELPGTYAFAAQNGINLPPGFVAHRAPGNAKDGMKIGGYKYASGKDREPAILIVMSVEEGQAAEIIHGGRFGDGTVSWRFVRATLSGDTLEFVSADQRPKQSFRWSSAAGGTVGFIPTGAGSGSGPASIRSASFERLDG